MADFNSARSPRSSMSPASCSTTAARTAYASATVCWSVVRLWMSQEYEADQSSSAWSGILPSRKSFTFVRISGALGMADYRLSIEEMRCRFNRGRYWYRMRNGEFTEVIIRIGHNINREILQRHPTARTIVSRYRNAHGSDIAEVHYYALPDGSIIPGKRPDPKLLFEDAVMYHQEPKPNRQARIAKQALDPLWRKFWRKILKWFSCRELDVVSPC